MGSRLGTETVAAVSAVSLPSVPIEYCEMVAGVAPALRFTTYARVPEELMVMKDEPVPPATVAGERAVSFPSTPMEYCDTVAPPLFVAYA